MFLVFCFYGSPLEVAFHEVFLRSYPRCFYAVLSRHMGLFLLLLLRSNLVSKWVSKFFLLPFTSQLYFCFFKQRNHFEITCAVEFLFFLLFGWTSGGELAIFAWQSIRIRCFSWSTVFSSRSSWTTVSCSWASCVRRWLANFDLRPFDVLTTRTGLSSLLYRCIHSSISFCSFCCDRWTLETADRLSNLLEESERTHKKNMSNVISARDILISPHCEAANGRPSFAREIDFFSLYFHFFPRKTSKVSGVLPSPLETTTGTETQRTQ